MKGLSLILFIVFLFQVASLACSCKERELDLPIAELGLLSDDSSINTSFDDYIFQGRLVSSEKIEIDEIKDLCRKSKSYAVELKFEVVQAYKGDYIDKGDTIIVYTSLGSCGFYSPINSNSIIFAESVGLGRYFTYRGDCCKSVSEAQDQMRYNEYKRFIEIVTNMIEGKHEFKQPNTHWNGGRINLNYTNPQLEFEIKDGEFNNLWRVALRNGTVIEEGHYRNGKRSGKWTFRRIERNFFEYYDYSTIIHVEMHYRKGKAYRKTLKELRRTYEDERIPYMIEEVRRIERTKIRNKD